MGLSGEMEPVRLETLPPPARELVADSLAWMESYGDPSLHLLRYPSDHGFFAHYNVAGKTLHLIRESAWWALGLLLRNEGDDAARAARILEAVLDWQYNEPRMPYHGTFRRLAEEPLPSGRDAAMWSEFDPNWRQFVGTAFLVMLELLPDRLGAELSRRLEASVRLALEGEPADRISPLYSNIAVMHAVMLVNGGHRFGRPDWTEQGMSLAREVYERFLPHGTFPEYHSPTYYGVILYALRLWRMTSPRAELAEWGATMERGLWHDFVRYYHPRLRNLCGPFDRAYGMDMTRYIAGLGLYLRLEIPKPEAPVPTGASNFDHAHDFAFSPLIALLGSDCPDELRSLLFEPITARQVEQVIDDERMASAYLGPGWMWGAQCGNKTCPGKQFHPVTAHWRQPDGSVGWLRLESDVVVDAMADTRGVRLTAKNGARRRSLKWCFPTAPVVRGDCWVFPGMTVRLKGIAAAKAEETGGGLVHALAPHGTASLALEFLPEEEKVG